jgi:NosR/NirI family transcriptional regulator, nitrous oxide reductase regulator
MRWRVQLSYLTSSITVTAVWAASLGVQAQQPSADAPAPDCEALDCAGVLPGATRFVAEPGRPWVRGEDGEGRTRGWVLRSIDAVDVPAYSGRPIVTLVGLDPEGHITGARVIEHAEPILLVGIPESTLHTFAARYAGLPATARVVVGKSWSDEAVQVDVISGATVTALALNRTILETARKLGTAVGVVSATQHVPGRFVPEPERWTWRRMMGEGVFGRLTVRKRDLGYDEEGVHLDLWFTMADAPQVGRAMLGDGDYEHLMGQLAPGEHLLAVLGRGEGSFKGSAFVRGGIFDRIRVQQDLVELVFRDTDYHNLSRVPAEGAPDFTEGAVFITRGAAIDPGRPFSFVFLGSRYDGKGGFSRDFHELSATHRLPRSVYVTEASLRDADFIQAWRNRAADVAVLGGFLLAVLGLFLARRWMTGSMARLKRLHLLAMVFGASVVGVYMGAQPSVTQILTLVDSLIHGWRWELFASEPLIFLSWIFIVVVSLVWGRGVFCGWVCPYGALTELIHLGARKLGIPQRELPDRIHRPLRWIRYALLLGLIPAFVWSPTLGEKLAEVEPFKSTFLVPAWTRHWGFFAWWAFLLLASLVTFRPFCRYLCPLGAGLALLNTFRFAGPRRRRFCQSCQICTRGCEPRAIRPDGRIDAQDCLSCMECEANYRDESVCPPLVGIRRIESRSHASPQERARLVQLRLQREDV